MVTEIAHLKARAGAADQLARGLRAARSVIARAPGYRGSVFFQGVETPESILLQIEWETLEDHVPGFRQGPLFAEWRSHFQHLLEGAPTVSHYTPFIGP